MSAFDNLMGRNFMPGKYECGHWAEEAWRELTGSGIEGALTGNLARFAARRKFIRSKNPLSPSVVLFQRRGTRPHAGIYLDGRVAHLRPTGPEIMPLDVVALGFDRAIFYVPEILDG